MEKKLDTNNLYSRLAKLDLNKKGNDTIYKHNGNKMDKIDFNSVITSNQNTISDTRKHNDSVSARINSVDNMFPMETSSMSQTMMASKLKKDIGKGKKSITQGITSGNFTREVNGVEIDRRSFNTTN